MLSKSLALPAALALAVTGVAPAVATVDTTATPHSADSSTAHYTPRVTNHIFTGATETAMFAGEEMTIGVAAAALGTRSGRVLHHADTTFGVTDVAAELTVTAKTLDDHDHDHDHGDDHDHDHDHSAYHGDDDDHDHGPGDDHDHDDERPGYTFGSYTVTVKPDAPAGDYTFTATANTRTPWSWRPLRTTRVFTITVTDEAASKKPAGSLATSNDALTVTRGGSNVTGYVTGFGDLAAGKPVEKVVTKVTASADRPLSVKVVDNSHTDDDIAPRHGYLVVRADRWAKPGDYPVTVTSTMTVPGVDKPVVVTKEINVTVPGRR